MRRRSSACSTTTTNGWMDLYQYSTRTSDDQSARLGRRKGAGSRARNALPQRSWSTRERHRPSGADWRCAAKAASRGFSTATARPVFYVTPRPTTCGSEQRQTQRSQRATQIGRGVRFTGARSTCNRDVNGDGRARPLVAGYIPIMHIRPPIATAVRVSRQRTRACAPIHLPERGNRFSRSRRCIRLSTAADRHRSAVVSPSPDISNATGGPTSTSQTNDDPNSKVVHHEPGRPSLLFHLRRRGTLPKVNDANAGMGIANARLQRDGMADHHFVTNSRTQRTRSNVVRIERSFARRNAGATHESESISGIVTIRLGRLMGRPRQRRQKPDPRCSVVLERRDTRHEPRQVR